MAKKIEIIGAKPKRIEILDKPKRRIDPAEIAAALGAEPIGAPVSRNADLIDLAELGTQLLNRLRSSGGRPALEDATEICRVPLSTEDVKILEDMVAEIEKSSGMKPSVGQLVSVMVRSQLSAAEPGSTPQVEDDQSRAMLRQLIDEQLTPLRERVKRLESEMHTAGEK